MAAPDWTEEAETLVTTEWRIGKSASEVAALLWDRLKIRRSRNAVIGIVHRRGLSGARHTPTEPVGRRTRPEPARRAEVKREPDRIAVKVAREKSNCGTIVYIERAAGAPPPPPEAKRLLELAARDCRFPIGEATGEGQFFCAAVTADDEVYCATHRKVCGGQRLEKSNKAIRLPRWARA